MYTVKKPENCLFVNSTCNDYAVKSIQYRSSQQSLIRTKTVHLHSSLNDLCLLLVHPLKWIAAWDAIILKYMLISLFSYKCHIVHFRFREIYAQSVYFCIYLFYTLEHNKRHRVCGNIFRWSTRYAHAWPNDLQILALYKYIQLSPLSSS